jgi:ectoine hydroxylase-related dioxygenase (phytanoyl-CoA dioxygenase family)
MKEVKKLYNQNGFYIAKSILSRPLLDEYISDFRKIFIQQLDNIQLDYPQNSDIFSLMQSLFQKDLKRYMSALTLSGKLFSLYKIISDQSIVQIIKTLDIETPIWQTKPVIHCMANELKIPNGYHGVGVHQDWPTLQSSLNNMTIWIPFTKVSKDNFPLEVIPGSHLKGLLEGVQTEHYFETNPEYYKVEDFIPMECDVGDVVFMSNFAIHRTQTEGCGLRLSVSMRYEDASEQTFIKRNYPYTEYRVVKREILFPNFPSQQEVKNVFKNE